MYYTNFNFNRKKSLIIPIVAIIMGAFFAFVPYGTVKDVIFTLMGLIIVLFNIFPCIMNFKLAANDPKYNANALASLLGVILGFLLIFNHGLVVTIFVAVYLIIMPIVRILLSQNRTNQLRLEFPLFLVAAILLFTPAEKIFSIILIVFGVILLALGVINLIVAVICNLKHKDDFDDFDDFGNFGGFNEDNSNQLGNDDSIIDAEVTDL